MVVEKKSKQNEGMKALNVRYVSTTVQPSFTLNQSSPNLIGTMNKHKESPPLNNKIIIFSK